MGICNGVNLSDELAFIFQFGVRPDYQGQGIGQLLWKSVLEHIGPERNVGVYAREEMVAKYQKKGFPIVSGHRFTIKNIKMKPKMT